MSEKQKLGLVLSLEI